MRRAITGVLLAILLPFSAWAEIAYVDDLLRVGVRGAPASAEAPMEVVTTGAALEVLERRGNFVRVRTEKGTVGWVNGTYISSEPPARLLLAGVEADRDRLQSELALLREHSAATAAESRRLSEQLARLQEEHEALKARLPDTALPGSIRWLLTAATMLLLLVLGVALGAQWHKQRIAQRFGGLDLR